MGICKIVFCSVFTLLFYIASSSPPDPNLGNVLSALYKQAAKSNKALVLVMDKKKNLNPPNKYVEQTSNENSGPQYNENKPKTHKHKSLYQYIKSSSETQDEGNDYKPVHHHHKHHHQHNSNHRVSYEYGYNPQNKEHNHGHYHHHEHVNPHAYASSYERPYHQEFSSYETLHDHHPLRVKANAPFKKINREGLMIKSLRNLLRDSLHRGKSRSRNELNQNKAARDRHSNDEGRDDHHSAQVYNNDPPFHFDHHGKLIRDHAPQIMSEEQNSHEEPHSRVHEHQHQHEHEDQHQHQHEHEDQHQHHHEETHQHNHNHGEQHEHGHDHGDQHEHSHDHHRSREDTHQHRYEDTHQHRHEEPHEHHESSHRHHDEPHSHGYGHQHYYSHLRQQDRSPPGAVTTPTPDPKATLDRHSNNYHMQKAFKALRAEVNCKSQALCKKDCRGDANCEAACEKVFLCYDNNDQNRLERPKSKGLGRCDDCGQEESEECPTECPTEPPCKKKPTCTTPCPTPCPTEDPCKCKHNKPANDCNKCPQEKKECDACSEEKEEECNVSTKGYQEDQDVRKKRL